MTDILTTIDETLTFYSAGLGVDLEVPVEEPAPDLPDIDLDSTEDWRAAQPDRPRPAGERASYYDLSGPEREEIHAWVREHGLEPSRVPIEGLLGYDDKTGEWRIRIHLTRDGKRYAGPDGDIATVVVRRRELRPLPWRVYQ